MTAKQSKTSNRGGRLATRASRTIPIFLVAMMAGHPSPTYAQTPNAPNSSILVTATPSVLTPAHGQMVAVTLQPTSPVVGQVAPACHIASVSSNEIDNGQKKAPDWVINGPLRLHLRAEKDDPTQPDRTYTITLSCSQHADAASTIRAATPSGVTATTSVRVQDSASVTASASHNAPSKYGATFYYWSDLYTSLPSENVYPPVATWDISQQSWWNNIVQRARNANLGFFAAGSWGQGSNADPANLGPLITAINSADTTTLKVALFDDTTSEVLRKNLARRGVWEIPPGTGPCSGPLCFDLADSNGTGEGGWDYFYGQQWKRFFSTIPAQNLFEIDGRPVVFMWHGGYEWYTNTQSFSSLVSALKAATLADFGFTPYVIVATPWKSLDPNIVNVADSFFEWFDPNVGKYWTLPAPGNGGVQVGHAIPGYDGSLWSPPRPVVDRQNGSLFDQGLNNVASASIVLIESINNVEENAHLIDTTIWGARELTTVLWYVTNRP